MFSFLVVLLEISLFNAKTRVKSPAYDSKYGTNKQILAFEPNKETKTEIVEQFAGCIGPDDKCNGKSPTTLAQISEQNKGKEIQKFFLDIYEDANLDELDVYVKKSLVFYIYGGKVTGKLISKYLDTIIMFSGEKELLSDITVEMKSTGKLDDGMPLGYFIYPIKELTIDYGNYVKKGDIVTPYCSLSPDAIGTVNMKVSDGTFTPKVNKKVEITQEQQTIYLYQYKIGESKSNVGLIVGVVVAVVVVIVIVVVVVVFVVLKKKKKNDNSSH